MRRKGFGLLLLIVVPAASHGQIVDATGPGSAKLNEARPGLFQLGSFYLTPYLKVGTLGVDTNVYYSATERQTDFTASGGPGLEVVRPFGRESRFQISGELDYLYFAKTESQRRLNGSANALLDIRGLKTRLAIQERYNQTFSRPNYEVNDRIEQETEATEAFVRRDFSDRVRLAILGRRELTRTQSYDYLGTDLGNTLTTTEYHAGAELQLALSIKSRFVGGGAEAWYRFPNLHSRDGSSTLAYGGFRTDASALIGGFALAGMRWLRLDSGAKRNVVYADVSAEWRISPKTKMGGQYKRDADYSSLAMSGPTPTNLGERVEAFVETFLTRSIYLRPYGRQYRLVSDGNVIVVPPDGQPTASPRNDRIREAGGEIGYQFRSRIRAALTVSYTDRISTIETFGVEGLLAGFTLQYNPPQPTFR